MWAPWCSTEGKLQLGGDQAKAVGVVGESSAICGMLLMLSMANGSVSAGVDEAVAGPGRHQQHVSTADAHGLGIAQGQGAVAALDDEQVPPGMNMADEFRARVSTIAWTIGHSRRHRSSRRCCLSWASATISTSLASRLLTHTPPVQHPSTPWVLAVVDPDFGESPYMKKTHLERCSCSRVPSFYSAVLELSDLKLTVQRCKAENADL